GGAIAKRERDLYADLEGGEPACEHVRDRLAVIAGENRRHLAPAGEEGGKRARAEWHGRARQTCASHVGERVHTRARGFARELEIELVDFRRNRVLRQFRSPGQRLFHGALEIRYRAVRIERRVRNEGGRP